MSFLEQLKSVTKSKAMVKSVIFSNKTIESTQEQHLAAAKKPPTTKSKSNGLFQLIKKIGKK